MLVSTQSRAKKHMVESLRQRWKKDWDGDSDRFKKQHYAFLVALKLAEQIIDKSAEMAADGRYSPEGRTGIMREWLKSGPDSPFKEIARARSYANMAKESLQLELSALNTFRPTPGDIVGAIRRNEIRQWLRSLGGPKLIQMLSSKDTPVEVFDALFDSPTPLSGIAEIDWDHFLPRMLASKFPEKIAEIEAGNEAATLAGTALRVAEGELKNAAAFESDKQFDAWAEAA